MSMETSKDDLQELLLSLPSEKFLDGSLLYLYKGAWRPDLFIPAEVSFQHNFVARDTDIILASMPKAGTTWLKALTFSIVNRNNHSPAQQNPLVSASPHFLVHFVLDFYTDKDQQNPDQIPEPRIFSCHSNYASLPSSIRDSSCKIVYICRNPLDQLVSFFHFISKLNRESGNRPVPSMEELFEKASRGVQAYGPFWDNVLGYWKASLERPDKVLFLKYEDLREDTVSNLKKLAEFLEIPFTDKEEREGVIEEIARLCSFGNLKDLEANKSGVRSYGVPNNSFFRKGEVGDWVNYLTPSMAESYMKIVEEKLGGSGLTFKTSSQ